MANIREWEKGEKIKALHDEGMDDLAIAGTTQATLPQIKKVLYGTSDTNMNGAAPGDEEAADAVNESRAMRARAACLTILSPLENGLNTEFGELQ